MPSVVGPNLHNDIVTPLQVEFLKRFFASGVGPSFFLTGGTALAGFYFGHRLSEDLDLFTVEDGRLTEIDPLIQKITEALDCQIISSRRAEYFRQFFLAPNRLPQNVVRIDLVRDFGPQSGRHAVVDGIIVDALENIGANKITAILGRTDAKDFVDLRFILKSGFDFEPLFKLAQEKDTGLTEFYLAQAMLQVRHLTRLPVMRTPLELSELQNQFVDLANFLLDKINPQNYSKPA